MKKDIISASILSANLANLGNDVANVLESGADWIHFDVMDNHYVPNLSFGHMLCRAIKQHIKNCFIDVHLMVDNPDSLIPAFANAGANLMTIHPESTIHLHRSIELIKSYGCLCGIAINPATSVNVIEDILTEIDLVLLMSVNPGFGGQKFIPFTIDKIRKMKNMLNQVDKDVMLQIDGGVNQSNIKMLKDLGVDNFVMGSAIFGATSYKEEIKKIRNLLA